MLVPLVLRAGLAPAVLGPRILRASLPLNPNSVSLIGCLSERSSVTGRIYGRQSGSQYQPSDG